MKRNRVFSRLYWQISAIFILVLVVFAAISLSISVRAARNYSQEVNQKLNHDLAKNMIHTLGPKVKNILGPKTDSGAAQNEALDLVLHSMMVINPIVEVYILDPNGKILRYVAPEKVVKLTQVSLGPVKKFLADTAQQNIVYGDDPRNPGEKKIFSAAEVLENGQLSGYIYIVLASQSYVSASQAVVGSYILGISIRSIIIILLVSALVGLLAIWLLTKKLGNIISGIRQFKAGKLDTRIPVRSNDELDRIGLVFNEMADTIQKNIEELKGIDELRKELISNVSHDLRTPVASIQGYAETLLLREDKLNKEERRKYLDIIYRSCERLKKLVSELFELSKLQTNQVRLQPEPFSIAELVHDVANKYRIISQKKGISINTMISKDVPIVKADISLIDRVLQNLIDNAVKFCKEGDYINIEINPEVPDQVKVRIADSGEGIKEEDLPQIFERYYKGTKYTDSTGLGLAIVKKIIDLHKSVISVYSRPGKGTAFEFKLPVAKLA